jgi:hypothetical protein
VLDMQPVGGRVPLEAAGARLGSVDMREWARTVVAIGRLVDGALAEGLFASVDQRRYEVRETFDDGAELVETVATWDGTTISASLAKRVRRASPPFVIVEPVLMRVLTSL